MSLPLFVTHRNAFFSASTPRTLRLSVILSLPAVSCKLSTFNPKVFSLFSCYRVPNPCRIRTSKTQDLKPFRIRTYEKTPEGEGTPPRPPRRYIVTSVFLGFIAQSCSGRGSGWRRP